jgi:hypothetical protein
MDYKIPGYIIEKLKELERQRQEKSYRRPYLEIPLPPPYIEPPSGDSGEDEDVKRGPIIIDINTYEIIDEDEE